MAGLPNYKELEYTAIALDLTSAAKALEKVKTILTRVGGILGVPLVYVIRYLLIPKAEENLFLGRRTPSSLLTTTRRLSAFPS